MAEHKSMNTVIHAAVRRDLRRFADALDAFPVGSEARAEELCRAWRHLDGQLHHHHHSEDTIFWPALVEAGADTQLMAALAGEHDRMAAAMTGTRTAMTALAAEPGAGNLTRARSAFAELTEAVESHFAHEERELDPFMIAHQHTPPMRRASQQIRRSQSPARAGGYFAWLQDGADADALDYLRREIPAPILLVFTRLLGRGYGKRVASVWTH